MAGIEYAAGTVLVPVPFSPVTVGNSPVGRPEGRRGARAKSLKHQSRQAFSASLFLECQLR